MNSKFSCILVLLLLASMFIVRSNLRPTKAGACFSAHALNVQEVSSASLSPKLVVTAYSSSYDSWSTNGTSPWLGDADSSNYIDASATTSGKQEGYFTFNTTTIQYISAVTLWIYGKVSATGLRSDVLTFYNSSAGYNIYVEDRFCSDSSWNTSWAWHNLGVIPMFTASTKLNSASIGIKLVGSDNPTVYISAMWLSIAPMTLTNSILFVNSFSSAYTQWTSVGSSPYLSNSTGNWIQQTGSTANNNTYEGLFGFPKLSVVYNKIFNIALYVEAVRNGSRNSNTASIYNDTNYIGTLAPANSNNAWTWTILNVTGFYSGSYVENTTANIDRAVLRFEFNFGSTLSAGKNVTIRRVYLNVTGATSIPMQASSFLKAYLQMEIGLMVNSTFPFDYLGSEAITGGSSDELLQGVLYYLQTHDSSCLSFVDQVCVWLNQTSDKQHLWFTYNDTSGGWQTSQIDSGTAAASILYLDLYAYLVPKWKPLLQETVNKFLSIYCPSNTSRVWAAVFPNGTVYNARLYHGSYCDTSDQGLSIEAMCLASSVLNNVTLKNIAYDMIMNYTLGAVNLPRHYIYEDGTILNTCKEDQDYANWLAALETFYYYFPTNATIKNMIKNVAWASQYLWNATAKRWNYVTNSETGTPIQVIAVHGFGMVDETLLSAYLIWGNTTWRDRARQDFDTLVLDGKIINHGLIDHSTLFPNDAEEMWNLQDRRTAVIFASYFNNQTYMRWANMLFWNVTGQMSRQYGIQSHINILTGADQVGAGNSRDDLEEIAAYINKTVAITDFNSLIDSFGLPVLGIITPILIVPIFSSTTTIDAGQSDSLTSNVTSGTTPYTYQWYMNDSKVSSATSASYTFMPSSEGYYNFYLNVTDGFGITKESNTIAVIVFGQPSIVVSPSTWIMDIGQTKTFTVTATGGSTPYTHHWYLKSVSVGTNSSAYVYTPSSVGSYTLYCNVTNHMSYVAKSNVVPITVNSVPSVIISPSSLTLDVGQSHTFTSTASGGTTPYSYQWYLNGTAVSSAIGSSWTFTPSSSASYTVYVRVNDAASVVATSNTASVTVNAPLSVTIIIAIIIAIIVVIMVAVSVVMLRRRKRTRNPT